MPEASSPPPRTASAAPRPSANRVFDVYMILYAYYIVYQGVLASMSRTICIYQDFLTEAHKTQIREAAGKAGFTPCFFTCDQVEEAKACLRDCEILYTCDPEILRSASASLQWCCSASAGVDVFCKDDGMFQNPACLLTNSNCYGVTIAEHIVMAPLMPLRRMPAYQEVIRNREWGDPLPIRSIQGASFTLLGTGNIGVNTARYLRNMGAAHITGVSRSGKPHPAFDEVFPISRLDDLLPQAHLLVMSLPETAETVHILNRERIALLPPDACVINLGGSPGRRAHRRGGPGRGGSGAAAPGSLPVGHEKPGTDSPCFRQPDAGFHLRSECGDVLPGSGELWRRQAPVPAGGSEEGILTTCIHRVRNIREG